MFSEGLPYGVGAYMFPTGDGCTGWKGVKFYGRPAWTFWMQRGVWESVHGALGKGDRVSETCSTRGCLTVEHLQVTKRPVHVPKVNCRKCGGILSRDKNNKSYCQMCQRMRARVRRQEQHD
jgi:hypothetical protein